MSYTYPEFTKVRQVYTKDDLRPGMLLLIDDSSWDKKEQYFVLYVTENLRTIALINWLGRKLDFLRPEDDITYISQTHNGRTLWEIECDEALALYTKLTLLEGRT